MALLLKRGSFKVNIGNKTVVLFHYSLRDETGEELESSRGGDPSAYLHGADNIIPGLEAAMTGHAAGDTVLRELAQRSQGAVGAEDIVVIAGGVIPKQDYDFLYESGVKCVFGPGTPIPQSAREVLDAVKAAKG